MPAPVHKDGRIPVVLPQVAQRTLLPSILDELSGKRVRINVAELPRR